MTIYLIQLLQMGKRETILLCMLFLAIKETDALASELGCPDLNDNPSFAEENRIWIRELQNWWKEVMEWKNIVEKECLINVPEWEWLFSCPDFTKVQCRNESSLHNETDQFGCSFVSCTDGRYHDNQALRSIWSTRIRFYRKLMSYYGDNSIYCSKSGCTEPSATTTEPMNEHSSEASMTTMMTDGGGPTTQPIAYTNRHPSTAVVDDTTPLTSPNSEATSTHEAQTDMTTMMSVTSGPDDKEWTVFQRRIDGSVDFNREWTEYANGFGNSSGEFWLGLENVHQLTKDGDQELRIDMITTAGDYIYAHYSSFGISSSTDNYILSASGYSGNATDALAEDAWDTNVVHQPFSTSDRDNDNWSSSCAIRFRGGWWFNSCFSCNLNGRYHDTFGFEGIIWINQDTNAPIRMRATEMKFRPK